jgi:beta-glucanase (GH16 family)
MPDTHAVQDSPNGVLTGSERVNVHSDGVYRVRVAVTTHSRPGSLVTLAIGKLSRRVRLHGHHRRAIVNVQLAIAHHTLVVRASTRRAAPTLAVTVELVSTLPNSATPSTTLVTRASGPTISAGPVAPIGSTGATGTTGAGAPSAPPPAPAPAPAPPAVLPQSPETTLASGPFDEAGSWHPIFDDEFNGTSLDTSQWSTGWGGSGLTGPVSTEEMQCYSPSQVVVGGGELDLNLIAQAQTGCPFEGGGSVNEPYTSGMIHSQGKFSFTYGYFETRVWLPGGALGVDWPGVWAVGANWPAGGEIDLVEGLSGQACWHFHDPQGSPGGCAGVYTGGWHTFGADWEPGSVTWYYDGVEVGTVTQGVTNSPMFLLATMALDNTYGGPIQTPATMRIDYIRIWQH